MRHISQRVLCDQMGLQCRARLANRPGPQRFSSHRRVVWRRSTSSLKSCLKRQAVSELEKQRRWVGRTGPHPFMKCILRWSMLYYGEGRMRASGPDPQSSVHAAHTTLPNIRHIGNSRMSSKAIRSGRVRGHRRSASVTS